MDNEVLRLPLDLLLVHDVETLETEALHSKFAVQFECELYFCRSKEDLDALLEEYGDDAIWYQVDSIEYDRIGAIIDLLNMAEEQQYLGHVLDRIVR